jgi:hypothetical protein
MKLYIEKDNKNPILEEEPTEDSLCDTEANSPYEPPSPPSPTSIPSNKPITRSHTTPIKSPSINKSPPIMK